MTNRKRISLTQSTNSSGTIKCLTTKGQRIICSVTLQTWCTAGSVLSFYVDRHIGVGGATDLQVNFSHVLSALFVNHSQYAPPLHCPQNSMLSVCYNLFLYPPGFIPLNLLWNINVYQQNLMTLRLNDKFYKETIPGYLERVNLFSEIVIILQWDEPTLALLISKYVGALRPAIDAL